MEPLEIAIFDHLMPGKIDTWIRHFTNCHDINANLIVSLTYSASSENDEEWSSQEKFEDAFWKKVERTMSGPCVSRHVETLRWLHEICQGQIELYTLVRSRAFETKRAVC